MVNDGYSSSWKCVFTGNLNYGYGVNVHDGDYTFDIITLSNIQKGQDQQLQHDVNPYGCKDPSSSYIRGYTNACGTCVCSGATPVFNKYSLTSKKEKKCLSLQDAINHHPQLLPGV